MARVIHTRETVQEVDPRVDRVTETTASYSVVAQIVYFIVGLIELLLAIRFVFRLTGANTGAGIVQFVYNLSDVFMAPFRFIFPVAQVEGSVFEWSVLVAMFFYWLLAWILIRALSILFTADVADEV